MNKSGNHTIPWSYPCVIKRDKRSLNSISTLPKFLSSYPITIPSRGSNLFATGISTELLRSDVTQIILEGFFPIVEADAAPLRGRNAGLREIGLSYAKDPALTKHLAEFLRKSLERIRANRNVYSGTIQELAILYSSTIYKRWLHSVLGLLENGNTTPCLVPVKKRL